MPSRYLIGIDLGTTNSVVAYIDTQKVADAGSAYSCVPRTAVGGTRGSPHTSRTSFFSLLPHRR